MAVRVRRHREVSLPDVLTDPGPRDAGEMEEGDPTVAEIVRGQRRHTGRRARTGDRGSEAIAAEALEDAAVWSPVLARYKLAHGLEDDRRNSDPSRPAGLRGDGGLQASERSCIAVRGNHARANE